MKKVLFIAMVLVGLTFVTSSCTKETTYTIYNTTDYTLYDVFTLEYDAASNPVGQNNIGSIGVGSTSQAVTAVSSAENVEVVFRFYSDGDRYVTVLKYPLTKGSNTTITLNNQTQVMAY